MADKPEAKPGEDPWKRYQPGLRESLKNSEIIKDAIRNCRERGIDKARAQKLIGAPYEVIDKIYNEKAKHDTSRKHTDDD